MPTQIYVVVSTSAESLLKHLNFIHKVYRFKMLQLLFPVASLSWRFGSRCSVSAGNRRGHQQQEILSSSTKVGQTGINFSPISASAYSLR